MIPKKIYYCWFGWNQKSDIVKKCIASWQKHCPDYDIIEINEDNFDVTQNHFVRENYTQKKRAFVADFARLEMLNQHWGVYLDTDMEVIKNIDDFLQYICFLWKEDTTNINFAIVWSQKNNPLLQGVMDYYIKNPTTKSTIVEIWTKVYHKLSDSDQKNITIFDKQYFYPFHATEVFVPSCITGKTHTIHWRDFSWWSGRKRFIHWLTKKYKKFAYINNILRKIYSKMSS